MKRVRVILWLLVGLAAIAGLWLATRPAPAPQSTSTTIADFGGPFTLTGSGGKPFDSASLKGRPYAMFFGFTHCPDVCPTTLARMIRLRRQLADGDKAFELLFISVDPDRDRPAELARYMSLFDAPVTALTGTSAEIEQVKTLFGIYSKKAPLPGGGYSVDHSSAVLLFDQRGEFAGTIAPEEGDAPALDKLKRIAS